jgi:hypothetical protein
LNQFPRNQSYQMGKAYGGIQLDTGSQFWELAPAQER